VLAISGDFEGMRPYELATQEKTKEAFHVYLFESIAMGKVNVINKLLLGGVPVGLSDGFTLCDTPLHWACSFGFTPVASLLLSHGADVAATNAEGQTALHYACKNNNAILAEMLLNEGANMEALDVQGRNPLSLVPAVAANASGGGAAEGGISSGGGGGEGGENVSSLSLIAKLFAAPPAPTFALRKQYQESIATALLSRTASLDSGGGGCGGGSFGVQCGGEDYTFFEGDDDDEEGEEEDGAGNNNGEPLLVLWPPPQRQHRGRKQAPLVLSSSTNISICAESKEIDTVTLLVDTLSSFGFQTEVLHPSAGAKIRLSIDQHACPGRHRFELTIDASQVSLVASDSTSLLYAVYTLVQLLQLHSEIHNNSADGSVVMEVPAIVISDWPDVANRAVLWSYRGAADTSLHGMKSNVELMSRLRINTLMLAISPEIDDGFSPTGATSSSIPEHTATAEYVCDLEETCARNFVDLVPTVVLTSLDQRLPLEVLKSFTFPMITIVLLYEQRAVGAEMMAAMAADQQSSLGGDAGRSHQEITSPPSTHGNSDGGNGAASVEMRTVITALDVENAVRQRCADIMSTAKHAGFTTITLACSAWTRQVAAPQSIAFRFGLECVERSVSLLFPSTHFLKPVICALDFIRTLASTSSKKNKEFGTSLSVMPAFLDSDFMMPSLLLKYYCFLHAGFSWNSVSMTDMLGEPSKADASIIREVASLLIFSQQTEVASEAYTSILALFTGDLFKNNGSSTSSASESAATPGVGEAAEGQAYNPAELARIEKMLWSLLTAQQSATEASVPTKAEAAQCLKYYRRLLNAAKWRLGGGGSGIEMTQCTLEVDELLTVVNILCVIARAIVLSHTAIEKSGVSSSPHILPHTFGSLLQALPPGTNSDTANSLLESLEHCASLWKRRFGSLWFVRKGGLASSSTSLSSYSLDFVSSSSSLASRGARILVRKEGSAKEARARFFTKTSAIPTTSIFSSSAIRDKLPTPQVVDATFTRLFG